MALPRVSQPPAEGSYVIPQLEGEAITIPGSKGVFRILASARQTEGAMAVFTSDGVLADAPGFHYHNQAHDIFMVTRGYLKLYAGSRCLIMGPGDFASVPPGIIHNPHMLGPFTQTLGLITPGDWVDFFRYVAEPFEGILAPEHDDRDLRANIMPKIMAAKDQFDVVFQPKHVPPPLGEWSAEDEQLPSTQQPYFLRANTGPRWILGGVLSRPFITTAQSDGKFAISSIESSSLLGSSSLGQSMTFRQVHHTLVVFEGVLAVQTDQGEELIREGESVTLRAGQVFALHFRTKYVRLWSFASGNGLEAIVQQAGIPFQGLILPDASVEFDQDHLRLVCSKVGVDMPALA